MTIVNVHESKHELYMLIQRVLRGEEIIFAQSGQPIARLLPWNESKVARVPGLDKGKIQILPSFDEPLEEFEQ